MKLLALFINVSDTVQAHEDDNWIMHHISDQPFISIPPFQIGGLTIDLSITSKILMLMISAAVMLIVFSYAGARNSKHRVPKGIGNFVEMLVTFVRNDIVLPSMGQGGNKLMPFFFTLFFFILFVNFLGLVPGMSTGTSSISVTAGLAIVTFVMIQVHGIRNNGFFGYFRGLIPGGVPVFVLPIMIIIEFLGLLTKPFALCIRLFANMTAGHIVIYALVGLIFLLGYAIVPVSIVFALFIYLLEILVALLQAYIFTMLSALFIGMAIHQEH